MRMRSNPRAAHRIEYRRIITRDRATVKDAYYLYKARWNPAKTVHICQQRYIDRSVSAIGLHVYSNCAAVALLLRRQSGGDADRRQRHAAVCFDFSAVNLTSGVNTFEVKGYASAGDTTPAATDSWSYTNNTQVDEVKLYADSAIVNSGIIRAEVVPDTLAQTVTWVSSAPAVATIDNSRKCRGIAPAR